LRGIGFEKGFKLLLLSARLRDGRRPAKDALQERPLGKAINNVKNNAPELLDQQED
jgi:hypothetical protein